MKVAIIGAGICGLYLAWKLAGKGHQVTVFEKKGKIGKETCSGLFSERILDFIPESRKLIQNQINSVLIHFPRKTLKIKFLRKFFVMEHSALDKLVYRMAEKSGARIILNYNLRQFHTMVSIWQRDFDRVIGCDGVFSQVRKGLGLPEPNFRLGIQGFIKKEDKSDFVETWPTKEGFIWKIPRGKEIEYGIIENPKEAKTIFDRFLKENNLQIENMRSALIPQGIIVPKNSQITLCGDAAGLTKSWSGGGVIWSLMAADLLLKNFPDFLKYKKSLEKFFSAKILFSKMVTRLVYFLGFRIPWLLPKNIKIEGDFLI